MVRTKSAAAILVVALGLTVCLALATTEETGGIFTDECGGLEATSTSPVARVVGALLSPYSTRTRWHAGNLVRHSVWTAMAAEYWLTDAASSHRYWVSGMEQAPLQDKRMVVFAALIHDIAKGGFPNCAYTTHNTRANSQFERRIGGAPGTSGTMYHPEAGARMVAGRLPYLVYKSNMPAGDFAYLQSNGFLKREVEAADGVAYQNWMNSVFAGRMDQCRGADREIAAAVGEHELYVLDMDKLFEVADLSDRKAEIEVIIGMHWGFGIINQNGLTPATTNKFNPHDSLSAVLNFLNTFEKLLRETKVNTGREFDRDERAKLVQKAVVVSYADVLGQSRVDEADQIPENVRLQLFDIKNCGRDDTQKEVGSWQDFGMDQNIPHQAGGTRHASKVYPTRRNYEILMALFGVNPIIGSGHPKSVMDDASLLAEWRSLLSDYGVSGDSELPRVAEISDLHSFEGVLAAATELLNNSEL